MLSRIVQCEWHRKWPTANCELAIIMTSGVRYEYIDISTNMLMQL